MQTVAHCRIPAPLDSACFCPNMTENAQRGPTAEPRHLCSDGPLTTILGAPGVHHSGISRRQLQGDPILSSSNIKNIPPAPRPTPVTLSNTSGEIAPKNIEKVKLAARRSYHPVIRPMDSLDTGGGGPRAANGRALSDTRPTRFGVFLPE